MAKVVLFNKPYGVHSQFRKEHDAMPTLADFLADKSLRVAGRLDKDSEGLLVLTDHGGLNHAITTPPTAINAKYANAKHAKTYLAQVEHIPSDEQIAMLTAGVMLKDGQTLPAKVRRIDEQHLPITLWQRQPPIRQRMSIPTAWLAISICEGKNRQVRRMLAQVGLPCLRLIRYQVGQWQLGNLAVGESRTLHISDDQLLKLGVNDTTKPQTNQQPLKFAKPFTKKPSKYTPKQTKNLRTRPPKFTGKAK
ncbi:pseudouridine synthase [Moraxella sp. ZJ142]|uniref:pseudouridine synthase n=1 Tax=Moraxella marmotae TaxID=3344520 RepID=UPI0035D43377